MKDNNILKRKELLVLISLVMLLIISWGWNALKPVDLYSKPHFMFSIPTNNNKVESLKNPMSVDVKNGILAATDSLGGRINFYYVGGAYIKSLKINNAKYLASVSFDNKDGLYVGDLSTNKIYYYENPFKSNARKIIASEISPTVIKFHNSNLYISDVKSGRIVVLNEYGKKVKNITSVSFANGIAFKNDDIFISDTNNGSVIKDINNKISKLAVDFSLPRGLAFDSVGNLHVVDTFANNVKVISNNKLKFIYGSNGQDAENFSYPNSIAIDQDNNRIYVADKGNSRIQVLGW